MIDESMYSKLTVSPSLIDIFLYSIGMLCVGCVFSIFFNMLLLKNENDIKKKRYLSHPLVDTIYNGLAMYDYFSNRFAIYIHI